MPFIDYLIKKGELEETQRDSLQYSADLDLKDFLIKSGEITEGRILFHWETYIAEEIKNL